jgi:hypothetical protein
VPVNVHLEVSLNAEYSSNDCVIACAVIGIFVQILLSLFEGMVLVPLGTNMFKTVTCSKEQRVYCENVSERENVIRVCGKKSVSELRILHFFRFSMFGSKQRFSLSKAEQVS